MQPSTSSPPDSNAAASPPDDVAVGHTALSCTPSGDLNAPSYASPLLVLDDMVPTGLLLFSGRDWIWPHFPSPESHSSILATAAEGEGGAKAVLSMEKDASYSTSGIHKDITVTPDLPPQLPPPSPGTDVATDGPSTRSLSAKQ
jgi:hypothetical protein